MEEEQKQKGQKFDKESLAYKCGEFLAVIFTACLVVAMICGTAAFACWLL